MLENSPTRRYSCDIELATAYVSPSPSHDIYILTFPAEWLVIAKSAVEAMPGDLPFPTVKEFLASLNEGWDSEEPTRVKLEQEGFDMVQVATVSQKLSLPKSTLVELIKPMLPVILGRFWTDEQRAKHEKHIPTALQQYLDDKYGASDDVPVEPWVIIATARKPC